MDAVEASTNSCPKCRADRAGTAIECAKCGIIFAKYRPLPARAPAPAPAATESRWAVMAREWLIESDQVSDSMTLMGRGLVFLLMVWWYLLVPE